MMKIWIPLVGALMLALSGCASGGLLEVDPESAAQRVLAAEADYYVAFAGMAAYENLARCENQNAPAVCSKQVIVDKLRFIDNRFLNFRDVAWSVVRSTDPNADAVNNVIASLTAVVGDAIKIVGELQQEGVL